MPFNRIGGLGGALTQPTIPSRAAAAPQEQLGLWQNFRQKLTEDPNLRMALLTAGLNMLKTPGRGQTGFDTFAEGALTGVGTLDQLRQREKAEGLAAAETEETRRHRGVLEEQGEQRLDIAQTQADTSAARVQQSTEQFQENLAVAKDRLAIEQQKANDARARGTSTPVTGQERTVDALIEALVLTDPTTYPATDEGRAKARLRVTGFAGGSDPNAQARIIAGLYGDLVDSNPFRDTPLTGEEMQERALGLYSLFSGDLTTPAEPEVVPEEDVLHPVHGRGTVELQDDGTYLVTFPSGLKVLTKAQLDQVRAANAQ